MNRCARHSLDIDTRDKSHTQTVDGLAESMRSCSFGIGYHPGIENVDNTYATLLATHSPPPTPAAGAIDPPVGK